MSLQEPFQAMQKTFRPSTAIALGVMTVALHISTNAFTQSAPSGGAKGAPSAAKAQSGAPSKAQSSSPAKDESTGATSSHQAAGDSSVEIGTGGGLFEQSVSTAATPAAGATGSAEAATPLGIDLNGYIRGDTFVGKKADIVDERGNDVRGDKGEVKAAYAELDVRLKTKKQRWGDAFAETRFRYGLQGTERNLFVELREAYVNTYLGPVDLRLGQQIVVWGKADLSNPTNNIAPQDLRIRSPIEDDWRVGNVGARAFLNLTPVRIEGVWMPVYVPSELPAVLPAYTVFAKPNYPSMSLGTGVQAVRVHLEEPSFETSFSYTFGYAPLPGLACGVDAHCYYQRDWDVSTDFEPSVVRISRRAYKQHALGFDFSTTLGSWGVRSEVAYRRPMDYDKAAWDAGSPFASGTTTPGDKPRPDLQYVLALDRNFGPVMAIAQYMGRYTFDWREEREYHGTYSIKDFLGFTTDNVNGVPAVQSEVVKTVNGILRINNQMLFQQRAQVQHTVSLRLDWQTLHETLSLSALGMVNISTQEITVFPKIAYKFSDSMTGYLGAQIFGGPKYTLYGTIKETLSAGYAELRISY